MRRLLTASASLCLCACGGSDDRRELRPGEATLLSARVAEVRDAVLAGERRPALDAVVELRKTVVRLAPRLEPAEQRALRTAVRRISARIRSDLAAPEPAEPAVEQDAVPLEEAEKDEDDDKGRGKRRGERKDKD